MAYMDEPNVSLRYVHWHVDHRREAWSVAKRFNARLNTLRRDLVNRLGAGEVDRIRMEVKMEEMREKARERVEEARRVMERRRALARQQAEAEAQQRTEAAEKEAEREQVQAAIAKARFELAYDLKRGAVVMRQVIKEFSDIDEMDMQDVQKQFETLGA